MAIRERVRQANAPKRAFQRAEVSVATVKPGYVRPVAAIVQARIMTYRRRGSCVGSWLFGSETGEIFLCRDGSATAVCLLRDHPGWHVGFYAGDTRDGKRAVVPSIDQLEGDIAQHMIDLGVFPAPIEQTGDPALIAA